MDKRYQIFISSTFEDLKEERKSIIESLINAMHIPAGMEMFNASNKEQFEYIKKIIDNCDYYILIIGARYGSIEPDSGLSYTEKEYDYAINKNIPVLAFIHENPYDLPYKKREDDKREQLEKFISKIKLNRMCKFWNDKTTLVTAVINGLNQYIQENPQNGWVRGNENNINLIQDIKCNYYYLLNVPRTIHINNEKRCCWWWIEDNKGYTNRISMARKFTCCEVNERLHNKWENMKFVAIPSSTVESIKSDIILLDSIDTFRKDEYKLLGNRDIYLNDQEISHLA